MDRLLRASDLCDMFSCSLSTLNRRLLKEPGAPESFIDGNVRKWAASEVESFFQARLARVRSQSGAAAGAEAAP